MDSRLDLVVRECTDNPALTLRVEMQSNGSVVIRWYSIISSHYAQDKISMLTQLGLDTNPVRDESIIKVCIGACLHHSSSHGVGFTTLPLPALLALPDVTLLAPVVQAITPHPVASELTGRLLLSTGLAHLPL